MILCNQGGYKECVNYARSLDCNIQTELQTNGLFSSQEDALWIANNFSVVWFSLDGPLEVNDKYRPDTNGVGQTSAIESNMKTVAQFTRVGVRSTVVDETVDCQEALVEYYANLGVVELALNPVIFPIERRQSGNRAVTKGNIVRFAKGFLKAHNLSAEKGVRLSSSLTFNFDEETNVACRSCLPMPQLNPDGSVSSCDMALYQDTKDELQCFLYGSWNPAVGQIQYDHHKIEKLSSRKLGNLPKCDACEIKKFCAGGCAGRVAFETGDLFGVIPEYCVATKYLARNMKLGGCEHLFTHP
jgi:radical SAM protein with 4Fe4S-binding SPASM domain